MAGDSRNDFYRKYVSTHSRSGESVDTPRWFPVLDRLPLSSIAKLLDVGCGDGALLMEAQRRGVGDVRGVDVSEEQVALARSRGLNSVVLSDARSYLSDQTSSVDCVTCVDFLEHCTPDEVLEVSSLVRDAIADGGFWAVQVPNGASPYFGNYFYSDLTHRTAFTTRSLTQLFNLAGFDSARFYAVGVAPGGGLGRALRRVVSVAANWSMRATLVAETGVTRDVIVTQNLVAIARKRK